MTIHLNYFHIKTRYINTNFWKYEIFHFIRDRLTDLSKVKVPNTMECKTINANF
jgi:hypothetical protein